MQVDVYRTVVDLLALPAADIEPGVQGRSFAPLVLQDPSLAHSQHAFSQYYLRVISIGPEFLD